MILQNGFLYLQQVDLEAARNAKVIIELHVNEFAKITKAEKTVVKG